MISVPATWSNSSSTCSLSLPTSSTMRKRHLNPILGFAVAAFLEPEILVVDEVLAVGDAEFQKKAIGKMKDVKIRALSANWGPQRKAA